MSLADLAFKVAFAAIILYIFRSHVPTDFGSNLTQIPIRNDGILPAFACLKIVILETVNMLASSSAVKAWTVELFSRHDSFPLCDHRSPHPACVGCDHRGRSYSSRLAEAGACPARS
jgi:hypothetical protein